MIKVIIVSIFAGIGIGGWLQERLFLSRYEKAPNFPYLNPTPAYVLKYPPKDYPPYDVVLIPK